MVEELMMVYSMKIKIRLNDTDADRTGVHQIKSTTSTCDSRRLLAITGKTDPLY